MKNKGFTLPEVLGVVILLSIITAVSVTQIINRINSSKGKISDAEQQLILSATQLYIDENKLLFKKIENNVYCIYVESVIQSGYLSSPIMDIDGNEIDYKTQVKAQYINGRFDLTYNPESCTENK